MQPIIYQLKTFPDLNFFFVPSSSVDGLDLLMVVPILQPTPTAVRPKMKKTVKIFYIFLFRLHCFASQLSETDFTKFRNVYDSYLATFDD